MNKESTQLPASNYFGELIHSLDGVNPLGVGFGSCCCCCSSSAAVFVAEKKPQ